MNTITFTRYTNRTDWISSLFICFLFQDHDEVVLWMNTVGPYHNRQETYGYFSLPFCAGNWLKTIPLILYLTFLCVQDPRSPSVITMRVWERLCREQSWSLVASKWNSRPIFQNQNIVKLHSMTRT